jgi:hypothetical protein
VQDGGYVRHPGDTIRLPFQQCAQLALQQAVLFGFLQCNFFVSVSNKNVLLIEKEKIKRFRGLPGMTSSSWPI